MEGKEVTGKNRFTVQLKARQEDYPVLLALVLEVAEQHTRNRYLLNDIEMSLGEIFSNIEFYSAADKDTVTDVTVTVSFENGILDITLSDNGVPFNPLKRGEPSLEENRKNKVIGGFGIFLVRKLMDSVTYEYNGNNILRLTKKLEDKTV